MRNRRARAVRVWLLLLAAAAVALAGCTDDEEPDQEPPAAAPDPAPAGLRVAVVLVVEDGGTDTADLDDLRTRLDELRDERATDVAALRVTVPDDRSFTADVAALLAGDGNDLVCLLGDAPGGVVVDLADRFPATRFCAIGAEDEDLPSNVQLIEVAQEELGYALGQTAEALADGDRVALLTAEDRSDRTRRRDGVARALGDGAVVQVGLDRDPDGELDTAQLAQRLDTAAQEGPIGAYLVDAPSDLAVAAAGSLPDDAVLAPARDTEDLASVVVRYRVDVAAIVGRALDRLIAEEPADRGEIGFADGAFEVEVADRASSLRPVFTAAEERLIAGMVDLEPPAPASESEPSEPGGDTPPEDSAAGPSTP